METNNIIIYIFSSISIFLSIIAIVVSLMIARRQRKMDLNIKFFDNRYLIVEKIKKDEDLSDYDISLFFSDYTDDYFILNNLKQEIKIIKNRIEEYLDYLSVEKQISKIDLEQQLLTDEINSEESNYDSFIRYCDENELTYKSNWTGKVSINNYYVLKKELITTEQKYVKIKNELIEKMLKSIIKIQNN